MATEWKKPIEKVPSVFSEKELLTMSFKEYWSIGLATYPSWKEARKKMDRLSTLESSADCKPVAPGCSGSTPLLSTNSVEKYSTKRGFCRKIVLFSKIVTQAPQTMI